MMKDITAVVEHVKRKTITVSDVVFVLNRVSLPWTWLEVCLLTQDRTVAQCTALEKHNE